MWLEKLNCAIKDRVEGQVNKIKELEDYKRGISAIIHQAEQLSSGSALKMKEARLVVDKEIKSMEGQETRFCAMRGELIAKIIADVKVKL